MTQLLQAAAALVLVLRLLHFDLMRVLPAMFTLQIWTLVTSLSVFFLYTSPANYFRFYAVSIPIAAAINLFAVNELFAIVFTHYPGIRTAARWIMYFAVGLAMVVSVVQALFLWPSASTGLRPLALLEVLQRSVVVSLAVFILCILVFLSRYALHLPRNFAVSSAMFCTIFLTEAVALLVTSFAGTLHNSLIELLQMVVSCICLTAWSALLGPMTDRPARTIPVRRKENEEGLLAQLENFNHLMSKVVRR